MASLNPLSGTLGQRKANHLLRRASFRFTKAQADALANQTAAQAVTSLLVVNPLQLDAPLYGAPGTTPASWVHLHNTSFPAEDFILRRYLMGWWINEALLDTSITHKMEFFYHQCHATAANTMANTNYYDYLKLIRFYALGNFKKLAHKMIQDNVMLKFLNNNENKNVNPNENFAREFFELFTIGKGPQIAPGDYTHYTEDDIVQAAKVFTGWRTTNRILASSIDPETGIPIGKPRTDQHEWGQKQFSAKFQHFKIDAVTVTSSKTTAKMRSELQSFVDKVFEQEETARNLCRRLYRYFVSRIIDTEIENDIIAPLALTLRTNNFEVKPVLEQLLQSQHFYDADDSSNADEIVGSLIKSPLELALQAMSFFGLPIPNPATQNELHYHTLYVTGIIQNYLEIAGMTIFFPPDVAGYPAYYQKPDLNRSWFNSGTIIARYKLPEMLLLGKQVLSNNPNNPLGTILNIASWVNLSGVISNASDPNILVQDLVKYMLPELPDTDRFEYFYNDVFLDNLPPSEWTTEWANYLATNDDSEVKIPLEKLIKALMYSPEYQTM